MRVQLRRAEARGGARTHTGVKAFKAFCTDVLGVSYNRPLDPLTTSLKTNQCKQPKWDVLQSLTMMRIKDGYQRIGIQG